MKKNHFVLLVVGASIAMLNTGCGQQVPGAYTGSINRVLNGQTLSSQATLTLAGSNNNFSGNLQDQYGTGSLNLIETNSTTFTATGTLAITNTAAVSQAYPNSGYGVGYPGYGGYTPAPGMPMVGYPTVGTVGYPGVTTGAMLPNCGPLNGTATLSGRSLTVNLTGTATMPAGVTVTLPGTVAGNTGSCSVSGTLTRTN